MRRWILPLLLLFVAWPLFLFAADGQERPGAAQGRTPIAAKEAAVPRQAVLMQVSGAIGPATADYVHRGFAKAKDANAALVILQMDTPGGLDTAMRGIIRTSSPHRCRWWCTSPPAARAPPAPAPISCWLRTSPPWRRRPTSAPPRRYASAACPIPGGADKPPAPKKEEKAKDTQGKKEKAKPEKPGMDEKAFNDAIAYIRGLAQLRGRNVVWAEKAVREAASIPAEEAVKTNVADLMAADLPQLLKKLDGRKVKLQSGEVKLDTKNLTLKTHEPDWRNRLLAVIADPNIAYILMLLGIYGLFFELWNPGYVLPGVIGGICLLLALYAFQVLPISYAGLGLILLGIAFMVGEAFMPSFGALGIGGLVAFVIGSIILFDTDIEGFAVAWQLIAAVAAMSAVFSSAWCTLH